MKANHWHAPLAHLALCAECSEVFMLALGVCPACTGQSFAGLGVILNRPPHGSSAIATWWRR